MMQTRKHWSNKKKGVLVEEEEGTLVEEEGELKTPC
jgi:hypothetical protein